MATFYSTTLQLKDPLSFRAPFSFSPYCIVNDKQGSFFFSDEHYLYFVSEKEKQPVKILENLFSVLLPIDLLFYQAAEQFDDARVIYTDTEHNKFEILKPEKSPSVAFNNVSILNHFF